MSGLVRLAMVHWRMQLGCCPILLVQRKRQTASYNQRGDFLALAFPVMSVTLQGSDLELLECLGLVQLQELVIDALSKSLIELTI